MRILNTIKYFEPSKGGNIIAMSSVAKEEWNLLLKIY